MFYGVQTLLALMDDQGLVPQVSIKDSPRFSYRGLMVDVARNFQPKQEIMKLLDVMAMYKMNKFHFHLSDNEGWRLEIPGIEELTSVSNSRFHSNLAIPYFPPTQPYNKINISFFKAGSKHVKKINNHPGNKYYGFHNNGDRYTRSAKYH